MNLAKLPRNRYTNKQLATIKKMREEGFDWDTIGERFGLNANSINNAYRYYMPVESQFKIYNTIDLVSKVMTLRDEGVTYSKIGEQVDKSKNAISGIVWRERRRQEREAARLARRQNAKGDQKFLKLQSQSSLYAESGANSSTQGNGTQE